MTARTNLLFAPALLAAATLVLPGCGIIGLIANAAKKNTVNMDKWEVQAMKVDLRVRGREAQEAQEQAEEA
jgi:hypothetical protein